MEVKLTKEKQRNATLKQEIGRLECELRSQSMESTMLKSQNETNQWKGKMYLRLVFILGILNAFFVYVLAKDKNEQLMLP